MRRNPQCTTSWSSTTSTLSRSGLRSASAMPILDVGHDEPHLPGARVALPELHHSAALQRLERRQAQTHPGPPPGRLDAIVDDLQDEGIPGIPDPDRDPDDAD